MMALLLRKRGGDIKITEEVVTLLARNFGKEVIALLLEKQGEDVKITEVLVKAAAKNEQNGKEVIALLLEKRGEDMEIIEEVVKATGLDYRREGHEEGDRKDNRRGENAWLRQSIWLQLIPPAIPLLPPLQLGRISDLQGNLTSPPELF